MAFDEMFLYWLATSGMPAAVCLIADRCSSGSAFERALSRPGRSRSRSYDAVWDARLSAKVWSWRSEVR
jgi:hypothetical protein